MRSRALLASVVGIALCTSIAVPVATAEPTSEATNSPATGKFERLSTDEDKGDATGDKFIVTFKEKSGDADRLRTASVDDDAVDKLSDDTQETIEDSASKAGTKVVASQANANSATSIKLDKSLSVEETNRFMEDVARLPEVEYIEPDVRMYTAVAPNDPQYREQWSLANNPAGIHAEKAWDKSKGDGVTVAVIDSGIVDHPDLRANEVGGYDFISERDMARDGNGRDANPRDEGDWMQRGVCGGGNPRQDVPSFWHGSHVAGTIAAATNNGQGVAGVAPGAKLVTARALGMCGGLSSDIADALTWATGGDVPGVPKNEHPAQVVNMSLGGESPRCSRAYQEAIDEATNRGAVVVVAAGNDAVDARRATPANCRNVITVGATGPQGAPSYFSNWGPALTISAPGGDERQGGAILSAVDSGQTTPRGATYGQMQGTSQATPHVAGVVALLKSLNQNMRFEDVRRALTESVQPVQNCSRGCGAGLLDAGAALEKAGNGSRGPAQPDPATPDNPAAPDNPADPSRPNEPNAPADPIDSTQPTGAPTITMNNSTPRLHDRVAVAVSGFQPGENVHFVVDSRNFSLGSLTADSEGKVRGIWRVRYLLRGHHVLYAVGENSGKQASTPFEIIF